MLQKDQQAQPSNSSKTNNEIDKHDEDKISTLPDSVLYHIASFLDISSIRNATLLSKRWEFLWNEPYLWTSFPSVIFSLDNFPDFDYRVRRSSISTSEDEHPEYYYYGHGTKSRKFIEIEERILTSRDSPCIQNFSFSCKSKKAYFCIERLNRYISAAIDHHVEKFHLSLSLEQSPRLRRRREFLDLEELPDLEESPDLRLSESLDLCPSLFVSKSIRVLEFEGADANYLEINPPQTTNLPNLQYLRLEMVSLQQGLFFLSNTPQLKTLILVRISTSPEADLNIFSKSLQRLVLDTLVEESPDCIDRISYVENVVAPVKADLNPTMLESYEPEFHILPVEIEIYARRLISYLQSLRSVHTLSLNICFLRVISEGGVLDQLPVSLCNLRLLTLKMCLYRNCIPATSYLLLNAPNIETLVVDSLLQNYWPKGMKVVFWHEDTFDSSIMKEDWEEELLQFKYTLNRLKTVEIRNFLGWEDEFRFLKFLLKASKALERIILVCSKDYFYCLDDMEILTKKISAKVRRLQRSSSRISISLSLS